MSKPTAIFSQTPVRSVRSSPVSTKGNSAKTDKNHQTSNITASSPRKCKIQTEVQSSPLPGANINVRNKLQFSCQMTPRVNQERRTTKPSPRKEQKVNEDSKKQPTGFRGQAVAEARITNGGSTPIATKHGTGVTDFKCSDTPMKINVKSMRSCFEHRENKMLSKPPPSPSPSRPKLRAMETNLATPRNNNSNNIKGILASRSRYEGTPTFRVPSNNNTLTPRPHRLRRSVSTSAISKACESPSRGGQLTRSSSQTITPKHRVKFQDEQTPGCFSPVLLEGKGDTERGSGDSISGEVTNLTVAVRVRPPFQGERSVVTVNGNSLKVEALSCKHNFSYDYCFDPSTSQQDVFNTMVKPLVDVAFQGYNVCLFAYGQTGSGKSYSMMGEEVASSHNLPDSAGIIPRFSKQLFTVIDGSEEYCETKVEISYFEIYNEKIHDLLGPFQNGRSAPLRVREHPELGPYVVDLTVHTVHSFETLQDWLRVGNSHRETAATEMNMNSSRSHSIFTVTLTQSQVEDRPSLCSKINLIDLAGSERLAHTCANADRLKEGVSINRSLLTLGKVISSLAENKKRGFVPYRESVLTWLLRESLGGNSHTAMLATISPSFQFAEETLSTLRYACQARNIVNTVRINETPSEKRIRELLDEIQKLKGEIDEKDNADCTQKVKSLQTHLDQVTEDLSRARLVCTEKEMQIEKLTSVLANTTEINNHDECERKIYQLQNDLEKCKRWSISCESDSKELKLRLSDAMDKNYYYEKKLNDLEQEIYEVNESNESYKEKIFRLHTEVEEFKEVNAQLKLEMKKLNAELAESLDRNSNYERDISDMKNIMIDIKNNSKHDSCDGQILMLQTALGESERLINHYKDRIKTLEKKCSDCTKTNHDGCEKEISALKITISELRRSNEHMKCEKVIEKLKTALSEAEHLVAELESDLSKLKVEKTELLAEQEQNQKQISTLKMALTDAENKNSHIECEERINTLKKALSVAKSMNSHVQCENKISELEMELRNLQSVTLSDHSQCDEKNNNLFFALEKYADENGKLLEKHKAEILEYIEKIQNLEERVKKLTASVSESKKSELNSSKDMLHLESQIRLIKEENSRLKKKKVEEDKKVSSLEEQVINLTKNLLDVKSQLRVAVREKETSESLCSQLQEQLKQQDRKLAHPQSSRQLFCDEKENWETPSKVIRRSIARHNTDKENDRCSLVVKAEEIHQALKDAEDICCRLKIPWVFHLEPEVTTHSWFDVNVRVWDQRNMSSVRWPRDVFLGWLKDMKDEIMSKPRGHKLFQSSPWLQNKKDPEPLPEKSELVKKGRPLREEVESLRSQIVALETLCEPKDKREVLSAVSALGRAVTQLSTKLGLSSPLRTSDNNSNA